jgi:HECT-like Ubiquitin-conjugating enzyme (E2)-binding
VGLDVTYVAEYQENLHNVYVMLRLGGTDVPMDIEVEILPTTGVPIGMGDRLLVKVGASCSPPLSLPVPVQLGKQSVRAVDKSFEFRILVPNNPLTNGPSSFTPTPSLMDALQLEQLKPQTFTCASCSLPLVQSSRIEEFRDLPSEYWSELLDAWMCHHDQKLSERLASHGSHGFWPEEKQCLIGGSYLLFDDDVMVKNNLRISKEEVKVRISFRLPLRGRKRRPALLLTAMISAVLHLLHGSFRIRQWLVVWQRLCYPTSAWLIPFVREGGKHQLYPLLNNFRVLRSMLRRLHARGHVHFPFLTISRPTNDVRIVGE